MAFGPKSKKRRAFAVRHAVRLAQLAGFDSLTDCLDYFRDGRFFLVDGDRHEPLGVRAFMAAATVRYDFDFRAPNGIQMGARQLFH